jgi:hypothetical protein
MDYKKKIFLFLALLGLGFESFVAQNLVPNPSFEDTVHCPTTIGQLNYAQFWVIPTQGTPDYFNSCSVGAHVPNNGDGNQFAHSGVAYGGFYTFNKSFPDTFREYIQTSLTTTLTVSHKYLVSFYLSLAEVSQYALSCVGALFSANAISQSGAGVFNYTPQILNKSVNMLSDKTNWMLVSDTLYSDGSEQYITIGNFKHDSQADTMFLGNIGGANVAYYYIDDVSVIDYGPMGVNQFVTNISFDASPNPSDNYLKITCNLQFAVYKITDMLGNVRKTQEIKNKEELIDVSDLQNGIYSLNLITTQGTSTKKIIVQH